MTRNLGFLLLFFATAAHAGSIEMLSRAADARAFREALQDRYIIRVAPNLDPATVAKEHGLKPDFIYHSAIHGFAAQIPPGTMMAAGVRGIQSLERDQVVQLAGGSQSTTTWGLDRIDQRSLPLNQTYNYQYTGKGVTAYVLDTGIKLDHEEFEGRAEFGFDAIQDRANSAPGGDCNGHGTHVAATVGGRNYGVAKEVKLISIRVMNCAGFGSTSEILAGMDYVIDHHAAVSVANFSITGSASQALDDGLRSMIVAGIPVAVAAGNYGDDACNYSPGRVLDAMVVGATDRNDRRWSGSNYGSCVSWFAPGVHITSAGIASNTQSISMTGTSMAAPHTVGVAALYLEHHPQATPAEVKNALLAQSTHGIVDNARSEASHLLFSLEQYQ